MNIRLLQRLNTNLWKRGYFDEAKIAEPAGGGGSPPSPSAPTSPPAPTPPAQPAEPPATPPVDSGEFDRIKGEHEKLSKTLTYLSDKIEIDNITGEVRLKNSKPAKPAEPTPDEIVSGRMEVWDNAKAIEAKVAETFKQSPFFAKAFPIAQENIKRVPIERRTEDAWRAAFALAVGLQLEDVSKYYTELGKKSALEEFQKQGGASTLSGSSPSGEIKDTDLDKVELSKEEIAVANKMIKKGYIKDLNTYKRNKLIVAHNNSFEAQEG